MKGEQTMSEKYFNQQLNKYSDFVPIQHLAEQFGLEADQLIDRLEKGCTFPVALLVPGDWDIQAVKQYPRRETRYEIYKKVFQGSERDLLKQLRNQ